MDKESMLNLKTHGDGGCWAIENDLHFHYTVLYDLCKSGNKDINHKIYPFNWFSNFLGVEGRL